MTVTTELSESIVIKPRPKPKVDRFQAIVSKWKTNGFDAVADFLLTKGRKSKRSALAFLYGLDQLNKFIEHDSNFSSSSSSSSNPSSNCNYNIETILPVLRSESESESARYNKIDVYKLLNSFISYLQTSNKNRSPATIHSYVNAARSYFQYNDIEVTPSKFKYRVSLPTIYKEDEEPIDSNDIKEILHHCNNRRLKAYLLVLASGGMRATEALAMREKDIEFSNSLTDKNEPAKVKVRKEYSKTRTERNIYISNEAARYLHEWIEWKYRDRTKERKYYVLRNRVRSENDLIFSTVNTTEPHPIYWKMLEEFQKVLELAGLSSRKEGGCYNRRKITFHSFRRFVKTTIANQTRNSDYSEWFLGHKKSPYYTNKPEELRRIYKEDCMKYLTFLDYPTLEATGRSFENKLNAVVEQKDKQIEQLKNEIERLTTDYNRVRNDRTDEINYLKQEIEKLKAATRDHITEQVNERQSLGIEDFVMNKGKDPGVRISPELTEMLYKTAKKRIDKTVSEFMKEHPEYFEK
ncbi:MAG TPA: tyrosine-type recombinase/integrase [Nitrososphaeraceae archaeon]|nr:tyrosine-type recombinase/integrase [Nitrososphaeraceae archaeon]